MWSFGPTGCAVWSRNLIIRLWLRRRGITPQVAEATLNGRAMGLDLEQRYGAITDAYLNHVCTGNSVYRAAALHQVGLFDETFGNGYDNDMSYRLQAPVTGSPSAARRRASIGGARVVTTSCSSTDSVTAASMSWRNTPLV